MSDSILIVDDEEIIVRLAKTCLRSEGYELLSATSAPDALATFRENAERIALVLLDRRLGDTDGLTLLSQMLEGGRTVPAIVMSGEAVCVDSLPGVKGPVQFLQKPFRPTELCLSVRGALGKGA